jgi:hypothetical protein
MITNSCRAIEDLLDIFQALADRFVRIRNSWRTLHVSHLIADTSENWSLDLNALILSTTKHISKESDSLTPCLKLQLTCSVLFSK